MTALVDRLPAAAAGVDLKRTLLSILVAVPYRLGWFLGAAATALVYVVLAVRVGWRDGRALGYAEPRPERQPEEEVRQWPG